MHLQDVNVAEFKTTFGWKCVFNKTQSVRVHILTAMYELTASHNHVVIWYGWEVKINLICMSWHNDYFFYVVHRRLERRNQHSFPVEQAYRNTTLAKSIFGYIVVYL